MSVRCEERTTSKIQYVYDADRLRRAVIHFLARSNSKYERLLAPDMMGLANEVCDNCVKASTIYGKDEMQTNLKKEYLLRARGACDALSVESTMAFDVLRENPKEGYLKADGSEASSASESARKIDRVAQVVGELIAVEKDALTRLIQSL